MTAAPDNQRARIRTAFASAPDYDGQARVQRDIAQQLAARIAELDLPSSPRVLEIGCGTGFLTQALSEIGLGGDWLITDIAPEMVERCRTRMENQPHQGQLSFAVLDGEHDTPVCQSFDLICSSLAVQWFDDTPAALTRMAEWLAPGGHVMVTTLGPDSFAQWRTAHVDEGVTPGTPHFASIDRFAALNPTSLLVDDHIEHHPDARSFIRSVKAIGAGTSRPDHRPLSPVQMRRVMDQFTKMGCAVTYQVVTCHIHRSK